MANRLLSEGEEGRSCSDAQCQKSNSTSSGEHGALGTHPKEDEQHGDQPEDSAHLYLQPAPLREGKIGFEHRDCICGYSLESDPVTLF